MAWGRTIRYLLGLSAIAAAVVLLVFYAAGVIAGSLPAPDTASILKFFETLGATTRTIVVVALSSIVVLAAIAPIVFAFRSGDVVTILISIVLVICTWAILFGSRTAIDAILAAVVYLASVTYRSSFLRRSELARQYQGKT